MRTFNPTEYIRAKYRQFVLKLDKEKDNRIISKLESERNATAYVRHLINKDLDEFESDIQHLTPDISDQEAGAYGEEEECL